LKDVYKFLFFFFLLQTPESYTEQAAKNVRDITASEQPSNAARKRICGDSFIQESSPNPKTQDPTLLRLMESLRSDDPTDYVKAQNHQVHSRLTS
jgi:BRCA1-associated RING domain protein 1